MIGGVLCLANNGLGIVVLSLVFGLVNVLEVKHLTHVDWQDPHIVLSECLTCTDSLACWEWHPWEVVSLLSIWGEVKWALGIESFRKELIWSLPLRRVMMQSKMKLEYYFVTFQERVLANLNVLIQVVCCGGPSWTLESHSLQINTFDKFIMILCLSIDQLIQSLHSWQIC